LVIISFPHFSKFLNNFKKFLTILKILKKIKKLKKKKKKQFPNFMIWYGGSLNSRSCLATNSSVLINSSFFATLNAVALL